MDRWCKTRTRKVERFMDRVFASFRKSRRTTIMALVIGLLRSQRVGLANIARGMLDYTTMKHRIKRIGRFVANSGVCSWLASECLINFLMTDGRRDIIAMDWTDMGNYMLLKATLEFRRRGIPIAWHCVPKWKFDKSQNYEEEKFVLKLAGLIGSKPWILVADRGFGRGELFETLRQCNIKYVIRVCGTAHIQHRRFSGSILNVPRKPRMATKYCDAQYRKKDPVVTHLAVVHCEPAPEPWYLATNLNDAARTIGQIYAKRMSIEEEIRDCKTGLGLKQLCLGNAERIARMLIIIAITITLAALTTLSNLAHKRNLQLTNNKPNDATVSFFRCFFCGIC